MERFRKLGSKDKAHPNGIWALDRSGNGPHQSVGDFITGGSDGKLKVWRFRSEKEMSEEGVEDSSESEVLGPCAELSSFSGHTLPVIGVAVASDAPTAASTSLDGTVKIWNLASEEGDQKTTQQLNVAETWGIAISADGQKAVTGGVNGIVQIIDTSMGMVDESYSIGQKQSESNEASRREIAMVMSVAFSPDGSQIAAGGHDGSVVVLDAETGKTVGGKFSKHMAPVRSISYLPTEPRTIITASDDMLVNLYDVDSGQVTGTCRGHSGLALCARGSDDGKYIVSGATDRCVLVWDRMMKEVVYTFKGHKESVWGVSYAMEGKRIVSTGDDSSISVLDSSNADAVQ